MILLSVTISLRCRSSSAAQQKVCYVTEVLHHSDLKQNLTNVKCKKINLVILFIANYKQGYSKQWSN